MMMIEGKGGHGGVRAREAVVVAEEDLLKP
jgi:hypothetical protein